MSAPVLNAKISGYLRRTLGNLSLSNEYVIEIGLPTGFRNFLQDNGYYGVVKGENDLTVLDTINLLCSDASLPGSTFATSEVKDNFLGVTQEFAHTRLYTDIDLTFYVDNQYRVLELFQGWTDYISGGSGGIIAQNSDIIDVQSKGFYRRFRYPDSYKTSSFKINKIEKNYGFENSSYFSRTYQLINCFPKSVASVPISYGPADILKLTVTFNYDRYIVLKENSKIRVKEGVSESKTSTTSTNTTSGRSTTNSGRLASLRVLDAKGIITPQQRAELKQLENK